VITTNIGIFKAIVIPICSLVILDTPILAPMTSMLYWGYSPESPNIVVLRYFSCPHRSINYMTFELPSTISGHAFFFLVVKMSFLNGTTCYPCSSNPKISCAIEEVLPLSFSWPKLKTFSLREPRPSSVVPAGQESTTVKVDLPESTFPTTAIFRVSLCFWWSPCFW